jgi:putative phosphoribosyl transferase
MRYRNRYVAGKRLAQALTAYKSRSDVIVLGLPRGGVPVAYEVARSLDVPLDVFIVRKLGMPGQREFAMGAIASGGVTLIDHDLVRQTRVPRAEVEAVIAAERTELDRRERLYRGDRPPLDVRGRTVILVDDGLATGASMQAAIAALRPQRPAAIVVATPVGSAEACRTMLAVADACVCVEMPEPFYAVGLWYDDFGETTDDEVTELLDEASAAAPNRAYQEI